MFTDVVEVKKFLTHPRFVLVDNKEDADILWIRGHFKDFRCVANLCLHVKNYLIKLIYAKSFCFISTGIPFNIIRGTLRVPFFAPHDITREMSFCNWVVMMA